MNYRNRRFPFRTLLIVGCFVAASGHAQVTGEDILQGMGILQDDVDRLESGDVLAYSDKLYENSSRELAADAIVLVNNDLNAVH